jgi:hypothetical protein
MYIWAWMCGSSDRAPAYQVGSLEFKLHYYQRNKNQKQPPCPLPEFELELKW